MFLNVYNQEHLPVNDFMRVLFEGKLRHGLFAVPVLNLR